MMRRELIFAPAAAHDLRLITEKTRLDWSLAQSFEYAEALFASFQRIAANPEIGRTRNELVNGLRSWPVQSHVVFYRVADDRIDVARILHVRQDPRRAFS